MIIGVDFDNTIVCYDGLFHRLAVEQGLVPPSVPPAKKAVRDYLVGIDQEDRWTELQGYAYGPGMRAARLFPGVLEFFARCRAFGVQVHIISHRTRYPFLGERHDLHQAARDFLAEHGFNDPARIGLPVDHIWFYETKAEKIAQINATCCTHFVDDLPEILNAPELSTGVEKILFDPNGQQADCAGMRRIESWAAVEEHLLGRVEQNDPSPESVSGLLAAAGFRRNCTLASLPGGGNNRVYRIDCEDRPLLLKAYFHHPDDPRDRLAAEFDFSRFAWDRGIRCIPQPIARDDANHLGLYEFIEGRQLVANEIGADEANQAAEFFRKLNRHRSDPAAAALSPASEACFTLAEHLACVERRVERLRKLEEDSRLASEAAAWVRETLGSKWNEVRSLAKRQAVDQSVSLEERLPVDSRFLSPSDFGFHNAILAADHRLRFLDFEYAGWDDPAKTVCDFLSQPKLPVPEKLAEEFTKTVLNGYADTEFLRRRVAILLPVYRVKWCCIMMNEFLPLGGRRRSFAQSAADIEDRKRNQLDKSARALERIGV